MVLGLCPKGHIDEGENALDAAKREIYEESGIKDLVLIKKFGSYERYKIGKNSGDDLSEFKLIIVFLFKTKTIETSPKNPHNQENKWVNKNKVSRQLTHRKDKEFFEKYIDKI